MNSSGPADGPTAFGRMFTSQEVPISIIIINASTNIMFVIKKDGNHVNLCTVETFSQGDTAGPGNPTGNSNSKNVGVEPPKSLT